MSNWETIVLGVLIIGIVLLFLYGILYMVISDILYRSIKRRLKLRIVEVSQLNEIDPPGNQKIYRVEGKTFLGTWMNISLSNEYYDSYSLAKEILDAFYYNNKYGYRITDDFDRYLKKFDGRYIVKVHYDKVIALKECERYYKYDKKKYNVYQYQIVNDCSVYRYYKIYKRGLFGKYYLINRSSYNVDDIIKNLCMEEKEEIIYNN